jgi:GTP-binding protein HflX
VIAKLHALGHVQNEEQRDDGILIQGRFPASQAALFAPFVVTK